MSLFALGLGLPVLQRTVPPTIVGTPVWYAEDPGASTAPVNTALPTLPPTVDQGASVTASNGTWSGNPAPTFTYQWLSNGSVISGATGQTYTPTATDRGAAQPSLAVRVTASNGVGSPVSATSAETTLLRVPANTALPTVPAGPTVDVPVTATNGTWVGTPTPTFTYQWLRNGANITDAPATAQAYTPISADSSAAQPSLAVRVTGTNSQGSASATSAAVTVSGTTLTLELVNGSFDQIAIAVGSTERQTWEAYGHGVGNASDANTVASLLNSGTSDANARTQALFEDLNAKVLRLNNAETSNFISLHLPLINHAIAHGVDRILCTGYIWQSQGSLTASSTALAIHNAITSGIPITHCTYQNEPDGGENNDPPDGFEPHVRTDLAALRSALNGHSRTSVKVLGCEWAHTADPQATTEYDLLNAAPSLIPVTVAHGAGHIYADGSATDTYDDRWGSTSAGRIAGTWSCETGSAASPNAQARALSGLNNGVSCEIFHQGHAEAVDTPGSFDDSQKLMRFDGTKQPWWGGMSVLFKDLPRGAIFRHCTSSDRPGSASQPIPGFGPLATNAAIHMYRRKQGVLGSSSNVYPRIQMAAAKRPDTSWIILGVNSTDGVGSTNEFDLGASYPAATLQMTVTIGELPTVTRVLTTRRASKAGAISTGTANMVNGVVRFTLAAGETIAITG